MRKPLVLDPERLIEVGNICGIAEAAEIIELSVSRVDQLLYEDASFPRPVWVLKLGRVWDASELREWKAARPAVPLTATKIGTPPRPHRVPVTEAPDVVQARAAKLDALLKG